MLLRTCLAVLAMALPFAAGAEEGAAAVPVPASPAVVTPVPASPAVVTPLPVAPPPAPAPAFIQVAPPSASPATVPVANAHPEGSEAVNRIEARAWRFSFGLPQLPGAVSAPVAVVGLGYFATDKLALTLEVGLQGTFAPPQTDPSADKELRFGFSLQPGILYYLARAERVVPFLKGGLEIQKPAGLSLAPLPLRLGASFGVEFFAYRSLSLSGEMGLGLLFRDFPPGIALTSRVALLLNFYL